MICQKEVEINIMAIDATFWVAVSFIIFFGALIYIKIPQKSCRDVRQDDL